MSTATLAPVVREYFTLRQLADYCGMSVRWLQKRVKDPVRPLPHYKPDGKILVRRIDFDAWLEAYRVADGGRGASAQLGAIVDDVMAGLHL